MESDFSAAESDSTSKPMWYAQSGASYSYWADPKECLIEDKKDWYYRNQQYVIITGIPDAWELGNIVNGSFSGRWPSFLLSLSFCPGEGSQSSTACQRLVKESVDHGTNCSHRRFTVKDEIWEPNDTRLDWISSTSVSISIDACLSYVYCFPYISTWGLICPPPSRRIQ